MIRTWTPINNEDEETAGSNPTLAASVPGDVDGDGLSDSWEITYFGNLNQTAAGDPDGDLYTNEEEETAGTLPNDKFDFIPSADTDFLNDRWEIAFFGDTDEIDIDSDGDSYINSDEYSDGTNPANILSSRDSDGDGLADGWEIFHFIEAGESAAVPADVEAILARQVGTFDPDIDGFNNEAEETGGSDPNLAASIPGDIDGDTLVDAWETYWTTNLTTISGSGTDSDGDGFTNAQEFAAGSNPNNINSTPSDMNGNGTPDANETPKPYLADADTLHLWHLDEQSPPFIDAVSSDFNLQGMHNGANGWTPGLSGFGSGVSTNSGTGNNLTHSGTDVVGALVINGANQIDALYTFGTGKLRVGPEPAGYASWAGINATTGTAADDFDGDGVSNGIEYVLGGSAATRDLGKLPSVSTSAGNLVFTFKRDQDAETPETILSIQVGTNLSTWPTTIAVPNAPGTYESGTLTVTDNGLGEDVITLTLPQAPDVRKFARVNAVVVP